MYFPYLRGKQYELISLRNLIDSDILNNQIIPIIEPVKANFNNIIKAIDKFKKRKLPFVLIINPQVGDLTNDYLSIKNDVIIKHLDDYKNNYHLGYIINDKTTADNLDNFLGAFRNNNIFLIHYARFQNSNILSGILRSHRNIQFNGLIENAVGREYRDKIGSRSKTILIEDGFRKKRINSEYGDADFFSVLYHTYASEGFDGFGDYLMIGDEYSDSGGPAYAVAIHLSEVNNDEIWIRHFVSDSNKSPVDPGGKFYEALKKLIKYIDSNKRKFEFSYSCDEFRQLFKEQRYPGLGYVKKLSMQHHIELMNSIT